MTRQELLEHIREAYGAEPEYPFPRDNESCVFRHGGNRKWFALVIRVPYHTLGQKREGVADILNGCILLPMFIKALRMTKKKQAEQLEQINGSPA